jgi:hypothetical protein
MFATATLLVMGLLALCLMLAAHFVAPKLLGRNLSRLEAYAWGCGLGIWLPFAAWAVLWWGVHEATMPAWLPALGLAIVIAGAGLGTKIGWWLDTLAGLKAERALRDGQ